MGESAALEGGGMKIFSLAFGIFTPYLMFLRCWALGHPIPLLQIEGRIKGPLKSIA